ncbi:hypothetical protein [Tenuibacillus multivorans]|uniref:Uncharacterized protein n=1 Tax=Tenuibacillus multivorans TaxID=237069 RepID=A0A1H0EJ53_9BACI|nr:hypothetical protein [Tenuibacillus multivorans]GEL77137.1 hypothetical protein TMU01_13720 [Tenuibacillus multivorans]SDN82361.1 hypothetical protein SAMN05216498_3173 [Tenuibacillus multivorans]
MSERKKEIHVKDLVIKADHVVFERPERQADPFFWGPRPRRDERMEVEEEEVTERDEHDDDEHKEEEERDRRPPFFWI